MNLPKGYPEVRLHKFIIDNFTNALGLRLISIETQKARPHDQSDQGEHWTYIIQYPGANTELHIGLHWPGRSVFISFVKGKLWFGFDSYLKHIKNKEELERIRAEKITSKGEISPDESAIAELKLFQKYLNSDLAKVARGEEWKEIPFDWSDMR